MAVHLVRSFAVAVLLCSSAALGSACYVEEGPPPAYAYGYDPQYYDGYVVYYDDVGRPYYYMDGAVVWVPVASPLYIGLVSHWRLHAAAYHHWYGHYGYGFRGYHGHHR